MYESCAFRRWTFPYGTTHRIKRYSPAKFIRRLSISSRSNIGFDLIDTRQFSQPPNFHLRHRFPSILFVFFETAG